MAQQYDNTNTGLLRKNPRKERDNHPDYKGSINVNGQEFWLSAWLKTGREGTKLAGEKYMSISVEPKEDQQRAPRQAAPQRAAAPQRQPARQYEQDSMDDDIPF